MPLKKKKQTAAQKKPKKRKPSLKDKTPKKTAAKVKSRTKKSPIKKRPVRDVLGKITHYFPKVQAAVIKLKAPLNVGENIKIKGHTTDFTQNIASMQIDHVTIQSAKKGDEIGLLVKSRVRQNDTVYKA